MSLASVALDRCPVCSMMTWVAMPMLAASVQQPRLGWWGAGQINLLRNVALNSLKYKNELALVKSQNIDITDFEAGAGNFRSAFTKNYDSATKRFPTAIDEIDKSIELLQKTKEALLGADRNLRLANNKVLIHHHN
ncbi:MAG: DUF2130 domain-containing protein [Hydrogenophaga sp.]|nr:DUF2130 domain-containing protein [Hydrogenophaga sp.]